MSTSPSKQSRTESQVQHWESSHSSSHSCSSDSWSRCLQCPSIPGCPTHTQRHLPRDQSFWLVSCLRWDPTELSVSVSRLCPMQQPTGSGSSSQSQSYPSSTVHTVVSHRQISRKWLHSRQSATWEWSCSVSDVFPMPESHSQSSRCSHTVSSPQCCSWSAV